MDQRGVQRRKGKVERPSWRRWALSQTSENENTQAARKQEPCQAPCRPGAERASTSRRLALHKELHFSAPLIQEFCENETSLIQRMAIAISVQFIAIMQCGYIRYMEHNLCIELKRIQG